MQLAVETLNPHLKAHCLRMAKVWSGEAEKAPAEYLMAELHLRPEHLASLT
jgi:hypothetical protein